MKNLLIVLMALLLIHLNSNAQINIIPKPNEIKITEGKFAYAKGVDVKVIRGDEATKIVNQQIIDFLKRNKVPIVSFSPNIISINLLKENTIPNDGYEMNISPNAITISSSSSAGLFYGVQSLIQLINTDTLKSLTCMKIKDEPAFANRGLQLDVAHTFFKTDIIKEYIEAISKLKFNQFIWKLADEQTWRIESKKYPKITEVGTANSAGFYTQDDIKQVLQFAKEHFITVIPEIDLTSAVFFDDTTFQYKKNIIDEMGTLFPSGLIQISKPAFYANEAEAYIKSKGKKVIHIDNASAKDDIVVSFKNLTVGINAAKKDNDVIMAPHNFCSLDNYPDWDDPKLSKSMLYLPIDKVYSFDPLAKIKEEKIKQHIIGVRANIDTKFINNENKLSRQVYPRIFALAECFWTKKANKSSFKEFSIRLENIGYPGQITEKINMVKFK